MPKALLKLPKSIVVAMTCAVVMLSQNCFAWGTQAHQVIANLAYARLSDSAKVEVDRLLALGPGETLASISTWADEHRNPASAPWHYVNFPKDTCTYDAQRDCPDGKCVVDAINKQLGVLDSGASDAKRLIALKYVVHLVADVHQPLHAGYLDDRGGNTYQLQAFMRGSNLHALWDTGLIKSLNEEPDALTARLMSKPETSKSVDLSAVNAAQESCQIVGISGFYPERKVGMDYVERFIPVMEQRLVDAGIRLARLLNSLLH